MHDYEVLMFGGISLFGLSVAYFWGGTLGTFVGVILFIFGAVAGMYHHTLHEHVSTSSNRISKWR